jgi:hypothetical protein
MAIVIGAPLLACNSSSFTSEKIPIPEYYGLYIVSDGRLTPAKDAAEENRLKRVGDMIDNVTGIKRLSGISASPDMYLLIYHKGVNGTGLTKLQLGKFEYVERIHLGFIQKSWMQANMWILKEQIPLNIAPIKGQQDMYRIVPAKPLIDGVYALYFNLESVVPYDNRGAYDFTVGNIKGSFPH